MQNKVIFINNSVTYFFLHRKKFIKYFIKKNFKIFFAFPNNEKKILNDNFFKFQEDNNIMFFNLSRRSMNIFKELLTLHNIYILVRKTNPDIIYTTTIKIGLYLLILNIFFKKKLIINFSGLGFLYVNKSIFTSLLKKISEIIIKYLSNDKSIFIFENKHDLNYFVKNKILKNRICHSINGVGVNISKFPYQEKFINKKYVVTMISRIEKSKGVYDYLETIKLLKNSNKFEFNLVGQISDNNDKNLLNLLDECKKNKNFKYQPWTKNILEIYKKTHIGILTSFREGMSVFLMEALSCGIPVIASNIPSNNEIVVNNHNGFLVKLNSPKEIVSKLEEITYSFEDYLKFSKNARLLCENKFDENKILSKFENIIDVVANE